MTIRKFATAIVATFLVSTATAAKAHVYMIGTPSEQSAAASDIVPGILTATPRHAIASR
jgi:hypothetical protein